MNRYEPMTRDEILNEIAYVEDTLSRVSPERGDMVEKLRHERLSYKLQSLRYGLEELTSD